LLFLTRDSLHVRAQQVLLELKQRRVVLLTTEFVLIEVADALCSPSLRRLTVPFITRLPNEPKVEIIPASSELFAAGWALYSQRPDKEWGLTDCTSFALMTQRSISQAFTSDHHFAQAGFEKLL
jgi:uncharacterized protein